MRTGLCLFFYTIFVCTWTFLPILVWAIPLPIMQTFVTVHVLIARTKVWPRTPTTGVYEEYQLSVRNQGLWQIRVRSINSNERASMQHRRKSGVSGILHKMSTHILTHSSKLNIKFWPVSKSAISVCLSVCLSVYLAVSFSVYHFISLSLFLYVFRSVLSVSVCLSVSLNLCPPFHNLDQLNDVSTALH